MDTPPATHLYINAHSTSQTVTILKAGTAEKGKIEWGAPIGATRLKAGQRLTLLKHLSDEAAICTLEGDNRELLIYPPHIQPLTAA